MHILLLTNNDGLGDAKGISRRIHYDFYQKLSRHALLHTYGIGETDPTLSPLSFDPKRLFRRIIRYYKPDVVLVFSWFGWNLRNPKLPGDFDAVAVPRICLEVDYWNVKVTERHWYKQFNFVIQRGAHPKESRMQSVWLPFSCCEEDFFPFQKVKLKDRRHFLAFTGRGGRAALDGSNYYYPKRRRELHRLSIRGLVKVRGAVGHEAYPASIANFVAGYADTGRTNTPFAKIFEIMGSGTVLLTSKFIGFDRLFGRNDCCILYDDEKSLIRRANWIKNQSTETLQAIADSGVKLIRERHTDSIRIAELLEILERYLKTGDIVKKWGF